MVGEFGAFNQTPHNVALDWMRDCLEAWRMADWGWALWNFRGVGSASSIATARMSRTRVGEGTSWIVPC